MAHVAPTAIPLSPVATASHGLRDAARDLAWKALTPAFWLVGQAIAADYDRDAERARELRTPRA
jgi:hypothetical protein